jgi:hypothetical protein
MEISPNNPINHNKEPIGFLLIITAIPKTEAVILRISKASILYPEKKLSKTVNKEFIISKKFYFYPI